VAGRQLFEGVTRELRATASWVAWIRLAAVPFVFMEVAIERGNYPTGYERWAWVVAGVFALGAASLFWSHRRGPDVGFVAYVFDAAVVSAFVVIYSFEPGSPVRQLMFLPVIEAALRWGRLGGALSPLSSAPALAVFEWKVSERLGVPYDPGHVVFPVALQLLVGLIVGSLSERARPSG
jgi:multisubunit Na+/H+ antiporter MnhB subunit